MTSSAPGISPASRLGDGSPATKALSVLLHGIGDMTFNTIGVVLKVSDLVAGRWMRAEASALPEPQIPAAMVKVEIDEMWHFIKKACQVPDLACL